MQANEYGARSLACLSSNPHNIPYLIAKGALEPLLRLLISKLCSIRLYAARALCNLSKSNEAACEVSLCPDE
ncbi:MAG: hypothetical protein SGPRY_009240 [Prymnesium sp.]